MIIDRHEIDRLLFNTMRAVYQFERNKITNFDLNYEAIYVLQYLRSRSSAGMSEIAVEMNLPISSATRLIDQLQKQGFVTRKKAATDGRAVLVSLEPEGEKVVGKVVEHSFALISKNLEDFSDEDLSAFIRTARNIERLLNTGK